MTVLIVAVVVGVLSAGVLAAMIWYDESRFGRGAPRPSTQHQAPVPLEAQLTASLKLGAITAHPAVLDALAAYRTTPDYARAYRVVVAVLAAEAAGEWSNAERHARSNGSIARKLGLVR